MAPKHGHVWRCRRCGTPLGKIMRDAVVVHTAEASFFVHGIIVAVCRCLERNEHRSRS